MKSFTVCFLTGRDRSEWGWLRDSFNREVDRFGLVSEPHLIIVNARLGFDGIMIEGKGQIKAKPKPTIWQGTYRVTTTDWWANSNARNTAIALCETEWIIFYDDRCVLMPGYLDALEDAMNGSYVLAGAYEKRIGMTVEDGVIRHGGIVTARDGREEHCEMNKISSPFSCGGDWLFGCNLALPLEWALECNGYPEIADGLGFEDVLFGLLIANNGHQIKYDPRARVIQDRTPELSGPIYRKEDKGRGKGPQKDEKAWKLLEMFRHAKQAKHTNGWDMNLKQVRADVLAGKPWPVPPNIEFVDFYDNEPVKNFK